MPLRESGPVVTFPEAATPPPLAIEVTALDPTTVTAAVTGEVDLLTAESLRAALTHAMDTYRPRTLVVDLAGVPFLDAAGMTALIQTHLHGDRRGVEMELANTRPLVARSLRVAGLVRFLRVTPGR